MGEWIWLKNGTLLLDGAWLLAWPVADGLLGLLSVTNFPHQVKENLVDVGAVFGGGFDIRDAPLARPFLGLLNGHLAAVLHVRFVPHKDERYVLVSFHPQDLLPELCRGSKVLWLLNAEDAQEALARPEVIVPDGGIVLLTGSV